jgi:uncharacterized repeat protein (TIGR03803 family)
MKSIANALGRLSFGRRAFAVLALRATMALALSAQTFTTLHTFDYADGDYPAGALIQGADGNLYGTTVQGGANCPAAGGCGTVFKITPGGTLTTLYNFCSQANCADGDGPAAAFFQGGYALVQGADGDFYGTTAYGGVNHSCAYGVSGCGTIFKITPDGGLTTLYRFCSQNQCPDGAYPYAGLVQATDGNLYGTTSGGGTNCVQAPGCGTVFKITPSGSLTTLYSFCAQGGASCTDGNDPVAALVQAPDGNLYGTTFYGGAYQFGTVFKITLGGALTTIHSFCAPTAGSEGCADGRYPSAALVQGANGNLYGTSGVAFEITPSGTLTTLYQFCSQGGIHCTDGDDPSGLILGSDGNFYGTTYSGGANPGISDVGTPGLGAGTVFRMTPSGKLTTLHSFCFQSGCPDGQQPLAALVQSASGVFYGTTSDGGNGTARFCTEYGGCGTLFSLSLDSYTISGQVTLSGKPEVGVTVTLSGSQSGSVTTDSSGNYSFLAQSGGNYTVTPSLPGYAFDPPSQTFSDLSANQVQNFAAFPASPASSLTTSLTYQFGPAFSGTPPAGSGFTVTPHIPGYAVAPFGSQDFPFQTWNGMLAATFYATVYSGMNIAGSMPHLASGGGQWTTTFTLLNNGAASANAALNFFDSNGDPLPLPLTFPQGSPSQTTAAFTGVLAAGAALVIETAGLNQPLATGWAQLLSDGDVSGFAVFTDNVTASQQQQAIVPLQSLNLPAYLLWFDNTNGFATGVALANESTVPTILTAVIRDDTDAAITTQAIPLPPRGHTAFVLATNYPMTANRRGTVEFDVPPIGQVSVLGLSFNPASAFTSIPLTPLLSGEYASPADVTFTGATDDLTPHSMAPQGSKSSPPADANAIAVNLSYQFGPSLTGTPPAGAGFTVTPHIPGFTFTPFGSQDLPIQDWSGTLAFNFDASNGMRLAGSMPHFASGGGQWTTTFTLINTGTATADVGLIFLDDNGNQLPLPLTFPQGSPSQTTATFSGMLSAGSGLVIQTAGLNDPLATGWAELLSDGDVSGFAVFTDNVTAQQQQQAVVPLQSLNSSAYELWFDNTKGFSTGVALANASIEPATMTLVIRDDTGTQITTQTIQLPAQGHTAFTLAATYPMTANRRGTVEFSEPADGQVSVLGLSFNPASAFTSIPAVPQ